MATGGNASFWAAILARYTEKCPNPRIQHWLGRYITARPIYKQACRFFFSIEESNNSIQDVPRSHNVKHYLGHVQVQHHLYYPHSSSPLYSFFKKNISSFSLRFFYLQFLLIYFSLNSSLYQLSSTGTHLSLFLYHPLTHSLPPHSPLISPSELPSSSSSPSPRVVARRNEQERVHAAPPRLPTALPVV